MSQTSFFVCQKHGCSLLFVNPFLQVVVSWLVGRLVRWSDVFTLWHFFHLYSYEFLAEDHGFFTPNSLTSGQKILSKNQIDFLFLSVFPCWLFYHLFNADCNPNPNPVSVFDDDDSVLYNSLRKFKWSPHGWVPGWRGPPLEMRCYWWQSSWRSKTWCLSVTFVLNQLPMASAVWLPLWGKTLSGVKDVASWQPAYTRIWN